jgi:hypothetical protein
MGRIIGITHRVKQTKEGAARPTMVWVGEGDYECKLETETDELDFILGRFPAKFRAAVEGEEIGPGYPCPWQIVRDANKNIKKIPIRWDGLTLGDTVVMVCGGSGDRLAYAIARRGELSGINIYRLASFRLKNERTENNKDNDHQLLVSLFKRSPELFQKVSPRDLDTIRISELFFARQEAMKARIGCEQRLRQRFIGKIFLDDKGKYPEGILEDQFDAAKASDLILSSLIKEENEREKELKKAVRSLAVWQEIFEPLEGVGEMIAARLISVVGDIRRFETDSKFCKYLGVHVLLDGRFPRRRNGECANWNNEARQAMYLLGDQFNRRPDSIWGKKMREYKVKFRITHPEVLCQECKKPWEECESKKTHKRIYSDGHIHRMATWRTLTKFTEKLFRDWRRLYRDEVITNNEVREVA